MDDWRDELRAFLREQTEVEEAEAAALKERQTEAYRFIDTTARAAAASLEQALHQVRSGRSLEGQFNPEPPRPFVSISILRNQRVEFVYRLNLAISPKCIVPVKAITEEAAPDPRTTRVESAESSPHLREKGLSDITPDDLVRDILDAYRSVLLSHRQL